MDYKTSVPFPQNVYACILSFEKDHVAYLHTGLFENSDDDIREAQQRSTELIITQFPAPPGKILVLGFGIERIATILSNHGYDVIGRLPNLAPFSGPEYSFDRAKQLARFEKENTPHESYDAILIHESLQYMDTLMLFNASFDLLKKEGIVVFIDEFGLKRETPEIERVLFLKHLIAQATRCGFTQEALINLSDKAAPTLDYWFMMIRKHRRRILATLPVNEKQLTDLEQELQHRREKYQTGVYGYGLAVLKKQKRPHYRITAVTAQDTSAIRKLYKTVFGHDISPELWTWKYGSENIRGILAWKDNELVGFYGGVERHILIRGKPGKASQSCDVMVLPSERKRKGPFFLTASTYLEYNVGFGAPYLLAFGFPHSRAYKIGELLKLYKGFGKMAEVFWSATPCKRHLLTYSSLLVPGNESSWQLQVEKLWQQMSRDLRDAIVVIRDWNYIRYRYLERPEKTYDLFVVRHKITRKTIVMGVILQEEDRCFLLDMIGALKHIPLLILYAREYTCSLGKKELFTWSIEPYHRLFIEHEGKTRPLDVTVPTNVWTPGPGPESQQDSWWLMAGDTEFL